MLFALRNAEEEDFKPDCCPKICLKLTLVQFLHFQMESIETPKTKKAWANPEYA